MADIVLTTLNARYAHAAFGLRYLLASLGELAGRAAIVEFEIAQRPNDILEKLLAHKPRIIGLGVYIWNVEPATQLAAMLKRLRPDITLILGGPEISHETDQQEITRYADHVITGEGDLAFADLCRRMLLGEKPEQKIIPAPLPEFAEHGRGARATAEPHEDADKMPVPLTADGPLTKDNGPAPDSALSTQHLAIQDRRDVPIILPYHLYTDEDLAHRVIYVEAARGCPFHCEFCLSSLDVPVRNVPLDSFLPAMQRLLDRGARQFKFVDRTFNLNLNISRPILQFFLDRYTPGLFLHFEMIPDRLPEPLRELIARFPPGTLQFEIGIQTFNEEVAARISRRQDNAKVEENLRFLRDHTGVHIHADLIAGLPGEDLTSFAAGFDRLVSYRPQEIQLGILKRLRGAPIARHDSEWGMVYSPHPPYEILANRLIDFPTMQRLRRFARYWDLVANSGNFRITTPLIWAGRSPFQSFLQFSDWLYEKTARTHAIALTTLAERVFEFLTVQSQLDPHAAAKALCDDFTATGRRDVPEFLKPFAQAPPRQRTPGAVPARQSRHLR